MANPDITSQKNVLHTPVLLDEVLAVLRPEEGHSYLDLTAGYGGHASAVLSVTQAPERAVLVDRDENAVDVLRQRLGSDVTVLHQDFATASAALQSEGKQFDMILADLGLSSPHIDVASRGFAINAEGPLDMRMDNRQQLTAERIVNTYKEDDLTTLLKTYGEEPKARAVARAIIAARPLRTTTDLAAAVKRVWPGHSKSHPATRTFQAIRIAVNDELGLLTKSLPLWINLLTPGGRLAIISFQSLEDRLVKQLLAEHSGDRYDAVLQILTKRPNTASSNELVHNPRARSAKLRAAVKINKPNK